MKQIGMTDNLKECRKKLIENHDRAEEIIAEREDTISRYRNSINEILDATRNIDDESDEARRWNWIRERLSDIQ